MSGAALLLPGCGCCGAAGGVQTNCCDSPVPSSVFVEWSISGTPYHAGSYSMMAPFAAEILTPPNCTIAYRGESESWIVRVAYIMQSGVIVRINLSAEPKTFPYSVGTCSLIGLARDCEQWNSYSAQCVYTLPPDPYVFSISSEP